MMIEKEEFVKRERNLGCLRRRVSAGFFRGLFQPSRCQWEGTVWNAWGAEVESRCRFCGAYRHHLFRDRTGEEIKWRAGMHPMMMKERGDGDE
jgi:hypothetical protein